MLVLMGSMIARVSMSMIFVLSMGMSMGMLVDVFVGVAI